MSQIIPVQTGSFTPPVVPQGLADRYMAAVEQMNAGFSANYNYIRPGKMDFSLVEGGVKRQVPNGQVMGVLLGIAPHDFCTWYEKKYTPGQEPERPDLLWEWPDHSVFPEALPAQYRQKVMSNGALRWDFRIARRSVWALVSQGADGQMSINLNNPYILDITSMSLFGKSNTQLNQYRWSGLIGFCNRFSQPPHFICSPSMFITQVLLDANSVNGVMVFRPMLAQDGATPQYLDNDTFNAVVNAMLSQQVQDMLKVREILEWSPAGTVPPVQTASAVAPQQTYVAPPTGVYEATPTQNPIPPQQQTLAQNVQPPKPAAPVQPSESLMDAAAAALNMARPAPVQQPQPAPQPAAPVPPVQPAAPVQQVNPTTAAAINALDGMF